MIYEKINKYIPQILYTKLNNKSQQYKMYKKITKIQNYKNSPTDQNRNYDIYRYNETEIWNIWLVFIFSILSENRTYVGIVGLFL